MSTEQEISGKAKRLANLMPPWKKGQSGNPKGRKPLSIKQTIRDLKKEGYQEPTQDDIAKMYKYMLTLDEPRIKEIVADKSQPMLNRIVGKNILGGKGFDIMERMIDRAIGKVGQKLDITTQGEKLKQEPLSIRFVASKEDLAKLEQEVPDIPDDDS